MACQRRDASDSKTHPSPFMGLALNVNKFIGQISQSKRDL